MDDQQINDHTSMGKEAHLPFLLEDGTFWIMRAVEVKTRVQSSTLQMQRQHRASLRQVWLSAASAVFLKSAGVVNEMTMHSYSSLLPAWRSCSGNKNRDR